MMNGRSGELGGGLIGVGKGLLPRIKMCLLYERFVNFRYPKLGLGLNRPREYHLSVETSVERDSGLTIRIFFDSISPV